MTILRRLAVLRPLLVFFVLWTVAAQDVEKPRSYFIPNQKLSNPLAYNLTGPQAGEPNEIAMRFLNENADALGLTATDLANAVITSQHTSPQSGVTHIYMAQEVEGLRVLNTSLHIHIARDGSVIRTGAAFVKDGAASVDSRFELSAMAATEAGAIQVGLAGQAGELREIQGVLGEDFETRFEAPFAVDLVKTKRAYLPIGPDRLRAVWLMDVPEADDRRELMIDATMGYVIDQRNYKIEDSFLAPEQSREITQDQTLAPTLFIDKLGLGGPRYEVFPPPYEYPDDGPRVVVTNPADPTASPFGWHDENGSAEGGVSPTTRGNNTHTYVDRDNNRMPDPGSIPDGGEALDFTGLAAPLNLNLGPDSYSEASAVNLFFWTNYLHDILYRYGFNEAAGNYQNVHSGNEGDAGDPVIARAQAEADLPTLNNANFLVTPDGVPALMNMYVWNATTPRRDGSFSNMIIAHEYAHGLSTRLTGGPDDPNCLRNAEQMGEGWSDFLGLVLTVKETDNRTTLRGVGTYVLGEDEAGQGIRPTAYTTDMSVNGATYEDLPGATIPHGVGYIWATMLWDLYWDLVDAHGFNSDFTAGWESGGNNLALQLVIDGMKSQDCSPGFQEGRDAILAADRNLTGGANQCLIWEAFARRGLGFSASEAFTGSTIDGFAAYDLPESCTFGGFRGEDREVCAGFDKTFDFAVGGLWSGTVTASILNAPQDAQITLTETSFTEFPTLTRMTIADSGSLAPGEYTITLVLDNGESQQGNDFTFTIVNSTPSVPTLKIPGTDERNVSYLPQFVWDDSSVGNSYTVEVSNSESFSSIIFTGRTEAKALEMDGALNINTIYYWRVISTNSCGQVASEIRSFSTQGRPEIPARIFPSNDVPEFNLANQTIYYFPDESFSDYSICREDGDGAWGYPTNRATVIEGFGDEEVFIIQLPRSFNFYGVEYDQLFLMSNGFVTLGGTDPARGPESEDLEKHFGVPRIALFWDDLDPGTTRETDDPAEVSYEITSDRVVVTFDNVSEFGFFNTPIKPIDAQLELFFDDGMIRMTYLDVAITDCLVGLSDGRDIPQGETNSIQERFDLASVCDLSCPYVSSQDRNNDNLLNSADLNFLNLVWQNDSSIVEGSREANDLNQDGRFNILDLVDWISDTGPCFISSWR